MNYTTHHIVSLNTNYSKWDINKLNLPNTNTNFNLIYDNDDNGDNDDEFEIINLIKNEELSLEKPNQIEAWHSIRRNTCICYMKQWESNTNKRLVF